jgi:hypothetical protein
MDNPKRDSWNFDLQLFSTAIVLNDNAKRLLSNAINSIGPILPAGYLEGLEMTAGGYETLTWNTALQAFE